MHAAAFDAIGTSNVQGPGTGPPAEYTCVELSAFGMVLAQDSPVINPTASKR
jgi:hypothetical protein